MRGTHESKILNALMGRRVKLEFVDGDVHEGILARSDYTDRYALKRMGKGDIVFYKSHVKNVHEIEV